MEHKETRKHPHTTVAMIAILDSNTLSSMGLASLLEELIPQATIRAFRSYEELIRDTPDLYFHYFVASGIFFEHTAFFLERRPKTIILTTSDNPPQLSAMRTLNICQDEQHLAKSILLMHHQGHPAGGHPHAGGHPDVSGVHKDYHAAIDNAPSHPGNAPSHPGSTPSHPGSTPSHDLPYPLHDLSAREIEVLVLLVRGLINKEIADKLNISLTTVITHRKNITEKLGIKSLSALTIYAVMHGYIEVDEI